MTPDAVADALDRSLAGVDAALDRAYPGDPGTRQPVHTVYVPADRFHPGTSAEWGAAALELFDAHAATPADVAAVWGLPPELAAEVHGRVRAKLAAEPIEDLRVDFEDGYGPRGDDEEDAEAVRVAGEIAGAAPFVGIRFRSLEAATRRRGVRTLHAFLGALGTVPAGFVLTLPKVTAPEQVSALVTVLEGLEAEHGLAPVRFEVQVETPQSVLGPDGTSPLPRMIALARGRCTGLHYGTYDYSASLGIAAQHQSTEHPVADHAKAVMQVAAAGTGVRLSDGSTNVLPVGSRDEVRAAWSLHGRLVRRSLERGFHQGWDLHPGHLPSRFVTGFAFYRETFPAVAARLRAYHERAGSGFLDEPATARAMAGYLLRGLRCGAVDAAELEAATGRPVDALG
ncbi:aldolase/citrate lyase family protein [Pseudonocardia petroleophila]|uniref:Aldolase n=1 Tax=Pseudonocardia petroleophila TaxID=37331 RepID=A0A7G7MMQ6_9PSEU|nr:aldolase/citrate lyase family protein [Pseudonocardia petroleophila]QNG54067.1 aldolase [Pseudonocardia petroleophila]